MRKVVGCALFTKPLEGNADARHQAVCAVVTDWLGGKGTWEGPDRLRLRDGRLAEYSTASWVGDTGTLIDHYLVEPSNNATVRTQLSIGRSVDRVIVYIELQAAGDEYRLAPMRVDIHSPNIVKTLIAAYDDWFLGEAPLSTRPISFAGDEQGRRLEAGLWHPARNLPVVAISSYEGIFLTDDFPQVLAHDLAGVAVVATIDAAASLALTRRRGQEWSCFNGAVRLYWPGLSSSSNCLANPLWTRHALMARANDVAAAASRIRRQLRRMLLGMSEFAISEPKELVAIRREHATRIAAEERKALIADRGWEELATQYAQENDGLIAQHQLDNDRIQELETALGQLQLSLRWATRGDHEVEPAESLQPGTVLEAVDMARRQYADVLVFGADVARGVATVAPDAGPPDKVHRYLAALAELAEARRAGSLGTSVVDWLNARGVTASNESETTRNSTSERRQRTWDSGSGARFFDLHLKPTDATHPDRCVRIYFDYDDVQRCVVVAWVGRHP